MLKSAIIARHERDAQNMAALGHPKSEANYKRMAEFVRSGAADEDIRRYHGPDAIDC